MLKNLFLAVSFCLLGVGSTSFFELLASPNDTQTSLQKRGLADLFRATQLEPQEGIAIARELKSPAYFHLPEVRIPESENARLIRFGNLDDRAVAGQNLSHGVWINFSGKDVTVLSGDKEVIIPQLGVLSVGELIKPLPNEEKFWVNLGCEEDGWAACCSTDGSVTKAFCYNRAELGYEASCNTKADDPQYCSVEATTSEFRYMSVRWWWVIVYEDLEIGADG